MSHFRGLILAVCAAFLLATQLAGCGKPSENSGGGTPGATTPTGGSKPAFTLAWSEYPSWSVFGVAHMKGIINGAEGKLGPVEEKWGVDIVLKETDYDTCITAYANGQIDAVCITNMDILNPSIGRQAVAILPTSTSCGADALITTGIDSVKQLRGKKVYGLEASVSQYTFVRNLELLGEDVTKHNFTNMDPAAASQAMITRSKDVEAIVVWNPFVLETLKQRSDAKVLFDSSKIPGEIIDMVVMGADSLKKEGGEAFARAVIDTFYQINEMLADPKTGDDTLVALGAKFSSLELEKMKIVVQQTQFYKTPADARALFTGPQLKDTMDKVVGFCKSYGIVETDPTIAYEVGGNANLTFTTKFIEK